MPQVQVTLGDMAFAGFEVPERIPFGGDQALTLHKMVGGKRTIDAMGRDDRPLEWSGLFLGDTALQRALYLDNQRVLGQPLVLTWSQLRYLVVIKSFLPVYEFETRIPYSISCEVAEDQNNPVTVLAAPSIDDQMDSDFGVASLFGGSIGDGPLSSALGVLGTAIGAVSTFANASSSTIGSVLTPIATAQSRVETLIAGSVAITQSATTLGGVLPNMPITQNVGLLATQAAAFGQQPALYGLRNVLGRMNTNLGNVSGSGRTVTTAGGNLYAIASQQYGDPMAWTGIAKANGLTDPVLSGVQTVNIPAQADNVGGVLGG